MIQRKPQHRLGSVEGAQELKNHPWLKSFPWEDLQKKKLSSQFFPEEMDNFDIKNIEEEWCDLDDDLFQANLTSLNDI